MQVIVGQGDTTSVELVDTDDFASLRIVVADLSPSSLKDVPGRVTFDSDGYGWINRQWLAEVGNFTAGARGDSFAKMVEFADRSGWVDGETGAIRAHLAVIEDLREQDSE